MRTILLVLLLCTACNRIPPALKNEIQTHVVKATLLVARDLAVETQIIIKEKPVALTLYSAYNEIQTYGSASAGLIAISAIKIDEILEKVLHTNRRLESIEEVSDYFEKNKIKGLDYKKYQKKFILSALEGNAYNVESHIDINAFLNLYNSKRKHPGKRVYIQEAIDLYTKKSIPLFGFALPVISSYPITTTPGKVFPEKRESSKGLQVKAKIDNNAFTFNSAYLQKHFTPGTRPTLAYPKIKEKHLVLTGKLHSMPPEAVQAVIWVFNCNIKDENKRYAAGHYYQKRFNIKKDESIYEIAIPLLDIPMNRKAESGTLVTAALGLFDQHKRLVLISNGAIAIKINTDKTGVASLR